MYAREAIEPHITKTTNMTNYSKELKKEEKQWTQENLDVMLGSLKRCSVLQIDEKSKVIKVWREDLRLIKFAQRAFIRGLCDHYGYKFQEKDEVSGSDRLKQIQEEKLKDQIQRLIDKLNHDDSLTESQYNTIRGILERRQEDLKAGRIY